MAKKTYDLFITHAWRYHDDWKRLCVLLDQHDSRGWRNFSLPWFDPALKPGSEFGGRSLRGNLETQIQPAHAVILLSSVFAQESSRKWIDFELATARGLGKGILALPVFGESRVPEAVSAVADGTIGWEVPAILAAVDGILARPAATGTVPRS